MTFQALTNPDTLLAQRSKINANFTELYGVAFEDDVTEASLPAASAGNLGRRYWITDRRGGCRVKSNGTAWIEQGPAINDVADLSAAAAFGALPASPIVGQRIRVTNVGNNPNLELVWNGDWWAPRGGEQALYTLKAPATATAGAALTIPNVVIPGGLMGAYGQLRIEAAYQLSENATALTIAQDWDGAAIMAFVTAHQRAFWRREIINTAVAAQVIPQRSTELGGETSSNTAGQTATKNTAVDRTIGGSITATTASGTHTTSLNRYNVFLVGA